MRIENVRVVLCVNNNVRTLMTISSEMEKDSLTQLLTDGLDIEVAMNFGDDLCLMWEEPGKDETCRVSLCNHTSDVQSEWTDYHTSEPIVIFSVQQSQDSTYDYHMERLKAENNGRMLSQEEYIAKLTNNTAV